MLSINNIGNIWYLRRKCALFLMFSLPCCVVELWMETGKDRNSLKFQLDGLMWNLWRGYEDDLVFLLSDLKEEKLYP